MPALLTEHCNSPSRPKVVASVEKANMFPADQLKANGGEIYAYIHENSLVGLARNLFWSITLRFEPIIYEHEDWECSMTCESIPWRISDWRRLDNID
ncbi:MAG TPA: hypothetical protein VFH31_18350 [Pyrinomonadaceae bacterium]|nr:hypothetical protein [Pyrinomonadaceae bacterium]